MCSDQDHRDTVFYEPPHDLGHRPLSGWMTRPTPERFGYDGQSDSHR